MGFVLCVGSFSFTFDSNGGFVNRRTGLLDRAREENVKEYLTECGVNNVKSVKLVEPQFPKHSGALGCGRSMLRSFAEFVLEGKQYGAKSYQEDLRKYCGVDIEFSTTTVAKPGT